MTGDGYPTNPMRNLLLPALAACLLYPAPSSQAQETPADREPAGDTTVDPGGDATTTLSGEPLDQELQALEEAYAEEVIKVRRELGEKYLVALKRLQDELTVRRQIEQALLVKMERERVADLLETAPAIEAPTAGAQPLVTVRLSPSRARCSGGAEYDESRKGIRNWTAAGAAALWDLDAEMPPGSYEVIAHYSAGRDAGGGFEVVDQVGDPVRGRVSTDRSSDWDDKKDMLVGQLVISADSQTLSVTCTSLRQPYLWVLRGITLGPEGTWREIEEKGAQEDGDKPKKPARRPLGELRVLEGARLLISDPGSGDSFFVRHDGETIHIRLYGVDAPHPSRQNPMNRTLLGKSGIEADAKDLHAIGKKGWSFVRTYLRSGPFRIYTYMEESRTDDRYYAYVVKGGSTLGEALVTRGLAIPAPPSAPLPDGTKPADYSKKLNAAAEAARSEKLGIWKLQKPSK